MSQLLDQHSTLSGLSMSRLSSLSLMFLVASLLSSCAAREEPRSELAGPESGGQPIVTGSNVNESHPANDKSSAIRQSDGGASITEGGRSDDESALYQPPNLAELIANADAVFVGEVGDVVSEGRAYYSATPTPKPGEPVYPTGVYQTWYQLWVRDIIKNDGSLVEDEAVTAYFLGTSTIPADGVGTGEGEYLYFMKSSPWPGTVTEQYGMPYGPFGRLTIDGVPVRFSDVNEQPVPFATTMNVSQFVGAVGTEIAAQSVATITPLPTSTMDTTPDP